MKSASESKYFMGAFMRFIITGIFLRVPLADHTLNEESIRNSTLKWTIIRPGGPTDGPKTRKLMHGSNKIEIKQNPTISRANVAAFVLEQLTNCTYLNEAVWLHE